MGRTGIGFEGSKRKYKRWEQVIKDNSVWRAVMFRVGGTVLMRLCERWADL